MKTIIIAEAGVNHNGDLELAKKLIDVAAEAGADYVKFQTFKTENLVSKTAPKADYQISNTSGNDSQFQMLKKLEINEQTHHELKDYCNTKKIKFLSTAFDLDSIEFLNNLGIDFFKIPSGEINNLPYLKRIGSSGKKIVLSTGMSDLKEIEEALQVLINSNVSINDITILHCNTEYPTPMEDVNLNAMETIKNTFKVDVGYSDHTLGIEVAIAAVAKGATIIEKHFTLDKNMEGPDHKAFSSPQELKAMVAGIRNIEKALGDGIKSPSKSEIKNKNIARKSIHIKNSLKKGHVLSESDLVMKRPGSGISPMLMEQVIGKKLSVDIEKDTILTWQLIQ